MREYQVRICEGLGVKFPGPTRHVWTAPFGHVWTAPFGQGFFGDLRLGRVQVMCPACLRGTRDRWP